jgi:hypothetical protein
MIERVKKELDLQEGGEHQSKKLPVMVMFDRKNGANPSYVFFAYQKILKELKLITDDRKLSRPFLTA